MSALVVLGVGLLGGVGAVGRFLLDGAVARLAGGDFPYGTFAVNVFGSLVLGVLVGAVVQGDAERLVAVGLVGSFTTFSTWAFESHRLGEDGQLALAAWNFAVSLVAGLAAVWAGRHLGGAL